MTISSTNISPISVCGRRCLAARYRGMQASSTKTELEREHGVVAQTEELLGFEGLRFRSTPETLPPHLNKQAGETAHNEKQATKGE